MALGMDVRNNMIRQPDDDSLRSTTTELTSECVLSCELVVTWPTSGYRRTWASSYCIALQKAHENWMHSTRPCSVRFPSMMTCRCSSTLMGRDVATHLADAAASQSLEPMTLAIFPRASKRTTTRACDLVGVRITHCFRDCAKVCTACAHMIVRASTI